MTADEILPAVLEGLGRFALSPGFGGLAVLIGGLLAFSAARRQSRDTREKMRQDRADALGKAAADAKIARQDRWWATLTWVYDRSTAERVEARLPASAALDIFDRLTDIGEEELQFQVIAGLHDLFPDRTDEHDGQDDRPAVTGESEGR